MTFQPTPHNVITLLLAAFALYVLYCLSKRQRDSNLPILFYVLVAAFNHFSDRPVNTYLMAGGLILALLVRFEFMNAGFAKVLLLLQIAGITAIAMSFVSEVFG